MKFKVLIADKISPEGDEVFRRFPEIEVDRKIGLSPKELLEIIDQYDGLVVRSATKVTAEVLENGKKLKVVGRGGIGVDNIDIQEATRRGIVVMNTPDSSAITTAEHTWALIMSMIRKIPQATQSMKEGKWEKSKLTGREIYGKTLGVIGLGNIGRRVALRGQAFGMKVVGYDPFMSEKKAKEMNIELMTSLDEFWPRIDILTCHTPLTPETRNLVNRSAMEKMKDGVFIVNCARGGIVSEEDLVWALKSGKVAGAAFDVFVEEPPQADHPLFQFPNFICTPHLGASTKEAQTSIAKAICEQIAVYLTKGEVRNSLNFPSIPAEMKDLLMPYLKLGERMGKMISQLASFSWEKLYIIYEGEIGKLSTTHVTLAIQKGLLERSHKGTLNYINAPLLLENKGIETITRFQKSQDFASAIQVVLKKGEESASIKGILAHNKDPRIVEVNDYPLEIRPEGYLLMLQNLDVPGVIGNVGSLLGRKGINISHVQLGVHPKTHNAISFWGISQNLDEQLLKEIEQMPNVLKARVIHL
ncbi:MAG: phosphoglycerate dehydrogenase [Planctomycetota bacterium]|nr:MAG: phosphoglycerate dehydrogenase [Planctomycetota bacterium]